MLTTMSKNTLVCALMHLLVDGLCACCLYMTVGLSDVSAFAGIFITYNVLAFLTQPLTGLVADHAPKNVDVLVLAAVAALSIAVLVASISLLLPISRKLMLFSVSILLGVGNSLFHVWGGKRVALLTHNDIRALGVFVSTGAMGLAIGMVYASWILLYGLLVAVALSAVAAIRIRNMSANNSAEVDAANGNWWIWCAILLLMAFVCLRSFLGATLTVGVAKNANMILLIGFVAMLGKALGGWVAKGVGVWKTLVLALAGTFVFLWLRDSAGWFWLPGVLLINCTMAVTLYLCNKVLPGKEGLAFGLLAASLMPGYLLAQLPDTSHLLLPLVLSLLLTVSIEVGVLWLMREKRTDVLWSAVVVNILTNLPLNLCLSYIHGGWTAIAIGEALVVLIEAIWYRFFTSSWKLGVIYSVLCNAVSFLCGLLLQWAILFFQTRL